MNESIAPPAELSEKILGAISAALQEEKQPRSRWIGKIVVATVFSTLILTLPMVLFLKTQLSWAWELAAFIWMICFGAGFTLHYYPQPRLKVPGYWSPWAFGRILIAMTLLTWLQILICPSFVFFDTGFSWSPFEALTATFMAWGGMRGCMFGCGVLFSALAGLIAFLTVRQILLRSSTGSLFQVVALAYLTQLPLIGIQVVDERLRPFAIFWGLGSAVGLVVMVVFIKPLIRVASR